MRNCSAYIFIIIVLVLNSCSSSRKAARSDSPAGGVPASATDYINKYGALAVSEMQRTGIPASITLAQGMLESGYGVSTLATKGNNHFGIKCHSSWTGAKIYHDDNRKGECFRAYSSVEDSYRDHSEFLVNGSRYSDLFKLSSTDYKGWAHGLKKAGYATDPNYAHLLIRKIEEYRLHDFDTGKRVAGVAAVNATAVTKSVSDPKAAVASTAPAAVPPTAPSAASTKTQKGTDTTAVQAAPATAKTSRETEDPIKVVSLGTGKNIQVNNGVSYIISVAGDTFESLAERHQLLAWEIIRYNDLAPGTTLQPGQVVYLQAKRNSASEAYTIHTVSAGETMHSISQKYAVRLSSLYKMNVMKEGTECKPGQKLRLR